MIANCTNRFIHHRIRLKSIQKHDVALHGGNVQVTNEWLVKASGTIAHDFESFLDLCFNLVVFSNFMLSPSITQNQSAASSSPTS